MQSPKKSKTPSSLRNNLILESLSTLLITYTSCWSLIQVDLDLITPSSAALTTCFSIMLFTWISSQSSGAHFNPAITISLIIIKKIEWTNAIFYLISQLAGAFIAGLIIYLQISNEILLRISDKSILGIPFQEMNEISGFWAETIGAFFIVWVYVALGIDSANRKNFIVFGTAMGLSYFVGICTVGNISGGCFNPARSLGPSLVMGRIDKEQFIQFFGPVTGGILAALVYKWLFVDDEDDFHDELENDIQNEDTQRILHDNE